VTHALPPRQRGALGRHLTAAAAKGRLELPVCQACGRVQYPPQEVCSHCLDDRLVWREVNSTATLLAATRLQHSNEAYFAARLPRRVGLVALDEGAQAVAHLVGGASPGDTVRLRAMIDRGGEGVLVGCGESSDTQEAEKAMQEFTFPPDGRRFAVYAADRTLAGALIDVLLDAGAASVCRLDSESGPQGNDSRVCRVALHACPNGEALRASIGAVDGLVVSGLGAGGAKGAEALAGVGGASAMGTAVHWPRTLVDSLREPLSERGGVVLHIGSVFAFCHLPAMALESALQAMANSLMEGERARGHAEGVRVLSLFAGPYGGPATLPLPAASPARIARAMVHALNEGLEESSADPVAGDLLARWRENPKVVERELAALMD
jgi:uncharacterized OB-fold protein